MNGSQRRWEDDSEKYLTRKLLSRHDIMYIGNKCKEFKLKKFKLLIHAATISKIVKFVT
jgi:hypothetical protein